jgi:hypothetical protein
MHLFINQTVKKLISMVKHKSMYSSDYLYMCLLQLIFTFVLVGIYVNVKRKHAKEKREKNESRRLSRPFIFCALIDIDIVGREMLCVEQMLICRT